MSDSLVTVLEHALTEARTHLHRYATVRDLWPEADPLDKRGWENVCPDHVVVAALCIELEHWRAQSMRRGVENRRLTDIVRHARAAAAGLVDALPAQEELPL